MIRTSIILFATFFIISCGGNQTKEEGVNEQATSGCGFNLNNESLDFTWTAYKFTEKTGVKGTFKDIKVNSASNGESNEDIINSIEFTIATASVFSNEPVRDAKISQFFFGTMQNSTEITGKLSTTNAGAMVALTLNGLTLDLPATVTYNGDTVELAASVDFEKFEAQEAIRMLNQVCSEQHKGADGKSVFWNTVDIKATAIIASNCD